MEYVPFVQDEVMKKVDMMVKGHTLFKQCVYITENVYAVAYTTCGIQ